MRNSPNQLPAKEPVAVPSWYGWLAWLLTLAGLGVATYLTVVHFDTTVPLACPDTGIINCAEVTTSAESAVFGVPVAVLGLAFFLFQAAMLLPRVTAWSGALRLRLISLGGGVLFVLWLVYSEVVTIRAICLWCTAVHLITLAYFLATLYVFAASREPR